MAEQVLTYQGRRYRMHEGRILLDWSKRPFLRHQAGCVLCCDVRITAGPGSPPRHPPNCDNCMSYTGPIPDPCWSCGRTAHHRDDDGNPTHKVCLERAITEILLSQHRRKAA